MYKLISLDLDGTTLSSQNKVSDETRTAIAYAKSKGVHVVVNTGRVYSITHQVVKDLGASGDVLCCVGTICFGNIYDNGGHIIFRHSFDFELSRRILKTLEDLPVFATAFSEREIYTDEKSVAMGNYVRNKLFPDNRIFPNLLEGMEKSGLTQMEKFSCVAEHDVLLEAEQVIRKEFPDLTPLWSSPKMLEIVPKGIDKGTGLRDLSAHYGIERREVIACGDSNNDWAMLRYAGLPVATANADDETKAICRYITKSNDEHGIAHMIYELI